MSRGLRGALRDFASIVVFKLPLPDGGSLMRMTEKTLLFGIVSVCAVAIGSVNYTWADGLTPQIMLSKAVPKVGDGVLVSINLPEQPGIPNCRIADRKGGEKTFPLRKDPDRKAYRYLFVSSPRSTSAEVHWYRIEKLYLEDMNVYSFTWRPEETDEYELAVSYEDKEGNTRRITRKAPVVWRDLYLGIYASAYEDLKPVYANMPHLTILSPIWGGHVWWEVFGLGGREPDWSKLRKVTSRDCEFWNERGVLPCVQAIYNGNPAWNWTMESEDPVGEYARIYGGPAQAGLPGVCIDEFGVAITVPASVAQFEAASQGLLAARKNAPPGYFMSAYFCDYVCKPTIEKSERAHRALMDIMETLDLIIVEAYCGVRSYHDELDKLKERAAYLREQPGLIDKAVFAPVLGTIPGPMPSKGELERVIRYIKRIAPEMPGVVFFEGASTSQALRDWANRMFYRYYILPVLIPREVTVLEQEDGKTRASLSVQNAGGMDAHYINVAVWEGEPDKGREFGESTIAHLPAGRSIELEIVGEKLSKDPLQIRILPSSAYTVIAEE